jgi:pentatricopeptide repeat protein
MFNKLFSGSNKKNKDKSLAEYLVDAIYAFETSDYKAAAARFRLITRAYPDHPLAHMMLARCCLELQQFEQALDALFKHLRIVPDSVEALVYLGLTYYECGEMEAASERYEEALQLRGNSILIRENIVITKIQAGELEDALDNLAALHDETPNDPGITELLVLVLGRLGRWEAAKQYVHEMKKMNLTMSFD